MEYWFYHLNAHRIEDHIPKILDKIIQNNWKALLYMKDFDRLTKLDHLLWVYKDDAFLPHGTEQSVECEYHPVLLTTKLENKNNADVLLMIETGRLDQINDNFKRVIFLFHSKDETVLNWARQLWLETKEKQLTPIYWKEDNTGRWKKIKS